MARFEWIAFLMSIIIMIAATTLVSLDAAAETVRPAVTWVFFISSIMCIFSCAHVCIMCLYIGNWAVGLALRGPIGSLNRAFNIVMLEKDSIEFWLGVSILSCSLQTIMSVWVLTNSLELRGYEVLTTVMGALSTTWAVWYIKQMHRRFFRPSQEQRQEQLELQQQLSRKKRASHAQTQQSALKAPHGAAGASDAYGRQHKLAAASGPPRARLSRISFVTPNDAKERDPAQDAEMESALSLDARLAAQRQSGVASAQERESVASGAATSVAAGKRASVAMQMKQLAASKLQAALRGHVVRAKISGRVELPDEPDDHGELRTAPNEADAPGKEGGSGGGAPSGGAPSGGAPPAARKVQRRNSLGLIDNPLVSLMENTEMSKAVAQVPRHLSSLRTV